MIYRDQNAEAKRVVVDKILELLENEGLTMTQANSIPDLLARRLRKNSELIGNNQKFTVCKN